MSEPEFGPEITRVIAQAAIDSLVAANRALAAIHVTPEERATALVMVGANLMATGLRLSARPVVDLAAARAIYGPVATPRPAEEGE